MYPLVLTLLLSVMSTHPGGFRVPAEDGGEDAALPAAPPPSGGQRSAIDEVLLRERPRLLSMPGVTGVSEGRTPEGLVAVVVWVTRPGATRSLRDVAGHPVIEKYVPGGFHAPPPGGISAG